MVKHKVQILWRPDFNHLENKYYYNQRTINETKLAELVDEVDSRFPKLRYKETDRFRRVTHSGACNYLPYEEAIEYL